MCTNKKKDTISSESMTVFRKPNSFRHNVVIDLYDPLLLPSPKIPGNPVTRPSEIPVAFPSEAFRRERRSPVLSDRIPLRSLRIPGRIGARCEWEAASDPHSMTSSAVLVGFTFRELRCRHRIHSSYRHRHRRIFRTSYFSSEHALRCRIPPARHQKLAEFLPAMDRQGSDYQEGLSEA